MLGLISVVVPVYNAELYLGRCIESILDQTYQNFELILVDDGSTDNSPAISDEWEKKDKKIRVFHKSNGGLSSARNYGIEHAEGEFIIFPDPDDYVEPDYLETLINIRREFKADFSICGHYYGDVIGNSAALSTVMDMKEAMEQLMLPHAFCGYAWNKLYSMDVINRYFLRFDEELGMVQDLHFNVRYIQFCERIAYDPKPVYHYVLTSGGVTSRTTPLTPRKISGLLTYKKIAGITHDKYPQIEAASYSSLCNMCLEDIMIYYKSGMKQKEIIDLLQKDFIKYRKVFYKSKAYTIRDKRCSGLVVIHPRIYYYARRVYLHFFGALTAKRKKKILICNELLSGGGSENLLQLLTTALVKKNYDVSIMCCADRYDDLKTDVASLYPDGVHFLKDRYPTKKYRYFIPGSIINYIFRKIYRLLVVIRIALKKYDVGIAMIEGHIMKDVSGLRIKRKIAWVQCDYRNVHLGKDWFASTEKELECMRRFEKIICVSNTAKEGILSTVGDSENLYVRYNPIDAKRIHTLSCKETEYIKDQSRKLIVSVGRLFTNKNYKRLLEACCILRDKIRFNLWIIGNGTQKEELERYIQDHLLTNVKLLGFQSNPYPIIKQADLFVSSSITESYGLAVQEALILGVPVVAVRNSGIEESFDTRYGILVNDSADEIAEAVLRVLEDSAELDRYRRMIKENYSLIGVYEDRMEKICRLLD